MATGDSADLLARVKAVIPRRWFSYVAPVRDAIIGGLSDGADVAASLAAGSSLIGISAAMPPMACAPGSAWPRPPTHWLRPVLLDL